MPDEGVSLSQHPPVQPGKEHRRQTRRQNGLRKKETVEFPRQSWYTVEKLPREVRPMKCFFAAALAALSLLPDRLRRFR
jgi:hypothetical protein